ncbi:HAD family hydrolase, partial [Burkholderia multivorans]|uniref:HAD family hydrolase n=1 Tax=Burkholderia multivorans TaxID=87883 RepID=UPI0020B2865F
MDGLLVDSERAIMNTWIAVALELGTALSPTDYLRIVGRASAECELILTELLGGAATFREALARVRQLLSRPSVDPVFPLKPGARALLTELSRAGVPCAVASSSPVEEIRSRLGRVSVLQFLETVSKRPGGAVNLRGELLTSGIGTTETEEMAKPIIDDELWT